jgi:hypothetical protein
MSEVWLAPEALTDVINTAAEEAVAAHVAEADPHVGYQRMSAEIDRAVVASYALRRLAAATNR